MKGQERKVRKLANSIEEFIFSNIDDAEFFLDLNNEIFRKRIKHNFSASEVEEIILSEHFDSLILNRVGSKPSRLNFDLT